MSETESQTTNTNFNLADNTFKVIHLSPDRSVTSEIEQQSIQAQSTITCLQAVKPNCAPTPNETSEFFGGNISIAVVLPENTDPNSKEQWTTDELTQIMTAFGLNTLKSSDVTLSPTETALTNLCPACVLGDALRGVAQFLDDVFFPGNPIPDGEIFWLDGPRFSGEGVTGKFQIQEPGTKRVLYESDQIDIKSDGFRPRIRITNDPIEHSSDCTAPKPLAFFDAGGQVCGFHSVPPTSGEPSLAPTADPSRIWINAAMNEIEGGKYHDTNPDNFVQQVRKFASDIRQRDGTDWALVVFLVDASHDHDGRFADGAIAWSQVGGPFMVLTNRLGGYGLDNLDAIFLHEFLHQFYALDEYHGSFDDNTVSGYLGIQNENHEDAFGGNPFDGPPSIMKRIQLVLDQNDFNIDRSPSCPGHWTTDPHCEVEVNGQKIGAIMDTKVPCQAVTGLTRGCFMLDWDNQAFGSTAPFFWFNSINVNPQGPLKVGETYRYGMKFLVNPLPQQTGRATVEVYTDFGLLIAARDLHPTRNHDQLGVPIFEDQYVQFTIPPNTQRVDIFFARCLPNVGEICSINAYDDFVIISDWVFRHELDDFAGKMLGFNDSDGDGLMDPIDTVPAVKLDTFFPQPILLQAKLTDLNTCQLTIGSETFAFSSWELEDVSNVSFSQLDPCRTTVSFDLTGPNPTATAFFERVGGGPCPPPCIPPTPTQNGDVLVTQENDSAVPFAVQSPSLNALLKIQANDFTNQINGVPVEVSPSDLSGAGNGLTPFTRLYAHTAYKVGTSITGWSYDIPEENMNPLGSHNSITINEITSVEYCVHGQIPACFVTTNPIDGAFDEAGEGFEIPSLPPGLQTLSIRSENSVKNRSNIFTMNFLVLPAECAGKTFSKVIVGTAQNDVLLGTFGADLILGLEGNDEIRGRGGADCLLGGEGNDIIYGNRGGDIMLGAAGDDTLLGGLGNDKLDGGDDFDTCKGGAGTNTKKNCEA